VALSAIDWSVAGWLKGKLSDFGSAFRTLPVSLVHFPGKLSAGIVLLEVFHVIDFKIKSDLETISRLT